MLAHYSKVLIATLLLATAAHGEADVTIQSGIGYSSEPRLMLDTFSPADIDDRTPLVVFVPSSGSGRWNMGEMGSFGTAGPALARRGMIVVVPEHRIAPEALFPNFAQDIARAIAWSLAEFPTSTGADRPLILAGDGTGAYVAVIVGVDDRYVRDVGLPENTVSGIIGFVGSYSGGEDCRMRPCAALFPDDLEDDWLPANHLDRDDPPMLLVTGDREHSEGIEQMERLAGPVARAGIEVTTLVVPDQDGLGLFIDLGRPGTTAHETVTFFVERNASD